MWYSIDRYDLFTKETLNLIITSSISWRVNKVNKKKIRIAIAIMVVLVFGLILYTQLFSDKYKPTDDEIALHIQMNTKEDVGLLVYDYCVDDEEYSGGMSNADKSLIKRNSDNIMVWNKQELNCSSDAVNLSINFRIITEYVEPNYENTYPKNITQYIDTPISWKAQFGQEYFITITGDKANGYKAELN